MFQASSFAFSGDRLEIYLEQVTPCPPLFPIPKQSLFGFGFNIVIGGGSRSELLAGAGEILIKCIGSAKELGWVDSLAGLRRTGPLPSLAGDYTKQCLLLFRGWRRSE